MVICDLTSFASVRKADQTLSSKFSANGIDVLCNNAGVMAFDDIGTVDGYDIQVQTNHLSHFLLTSEIFTLLNTAAAQRGEARVVNMSSMARNGVTLDAKYYTKDSGGHLDGNGYCCFTGPNWARYAQTKMANVAFTYGLRDKLPADSKVKSLVAHPGGCATNLQVTSPGMDGCLSNCFGAMAMSLEDGTQGLLLACCAREVKTGEFYGPGPGAWSGNGPAVLMYEEKGATVEQREMLWKASEAAIGRGFFDASSSHLQAPATNEKQPEVSANEGKSQ